jgi:hypothetical protein
MEHPEAGAIVRCSGGVKGYAGGARGQAKAAGLRVIYFVRYQPNEFWMLTSCAKAMQENVPAHILKQLKEAFEDD